MRMLQAPSDAGRTLNTLPASTLLPALVLRPAAGSAATAAGTVGVGGAAAAATAEGAAATGGRAAAAAAGSGTPGRSTRAGAAAAAAAASGHHIAAAAAGGAGVAAAPAAPALACQIGLRRPTGGSMVRRPGQGRLMRAAAGGCPLAFAYGSASTPTGAPRLQHSVPCPHPSPTHPPISVHRPLPLHLHQRWAHQRWCGTASHPAPPWVCGQRAGAVVCTHEPVRRCAGRWAGAWSGRLGGQLQGCERWLALLLRLLPSTDWRHRTVASPAAGCARCCLSTVVPTPCACYAAGFDDELEGEEATWEEEEEEEARPTRVLRIAVSSHTVDPSTNQSRTTCLRLRNTGRPAPCLSALDLFRATPNPSRTPPLTAPARRRPTPLSHIPLTARPCLRTPQRRSCAPCLRHSRGCRKYGCRARVAAPAGPARATPSWWVGGWVGGLETQGWRRRPLGQHRRWPSCLPLVLTATSIHPFDRSSKPPRRRSR